MVHYGNGNQTNWVSERYFTAFQNWASEHWQQCVPASLYNVTKIVSDPWSPEQLEPRKRVQTWWKTSDYILSCMRWKGNSKTCNPIHFMSNVVKWSRVHNSAILPFCHFTITLIWLNKKFFLSLSLIQSLENHAIDLQRLNDKCNQMTDCLSVWLFLFCFKFSRLWIVLKSLSGRCQLGAKCHK